MGDAPTRYSGTVGCGTHLARITLAELARDAGDLARAESLLREALAEAPAYLGTVEALARVLRARGQAGAEVVRTVHAGVAAVTPSVRFLLAVALYETGAFDEAEAELRGVLAAQPPPRGRASRWPRHCSPRGGSPTPGAWRQPVPDDAPAKGAALRTELFAALADGDEDAARSVLAAPAATGRSSPPSWPCCARGQGTPSRPSSEAADVTVVMLDALIRLERFDAFERLAVSSTRMPLALRERHERLAQLYLKRGFLESAADEWLAVCAQLGPDVAALRGLATVAVGRGIAEDAALLAAEAEALAGAARRMRQSPARPRGRRPRTDGQPPAQAGGRDDDHGDEGASPASPSASGPWMGRPPVQEDYHEHPDRNAAGRPNRRI